MSFPYQNIQAFSQLIQTQSSVLSVKDQIALQQLSETLPETIGAISDTITTWYQTRPHVLNAQLALLSQLSSNDATRVAGGTGYSEMTAEQDRKVREELINVIRRNTPTSSSESKPKLDTKSSR